MIEKPNNHKPRQAPAKRNRNDQCRYQCRAPVLQEQEHDEKDQHHGFDQGLDHFFDRGLNEWRRVVGDRPAYVSRKSGRDFGQTLLYALCRGKRVGTGPQLDRHPRHRLAVERGGSRIALRTDFDARDLAKPYHCRAGIGAKNDVLELFNGGKPAFGRNGCADLLPIGERPGADRAAGGLRILLANGGKYCAWGQVVGCQRFGIQPDPHGILRTEERDIAHTGHPAQLVHNLVRSDVAQIGSRKVAAFRCERDDHQEAGIRLAHGDPLSPDLFGQSRLDRAQAVLHLGLGDIDVGTRLEGQRDTRRSVRPAGRGHVEETLHPVELLFDDLRYVLFERLCVRTGIDDADGQRWWGDLWILFDRKCTQGDKARQQDAE